jgi:hypothetical protein
MLVNRAGDVAEHERVRFVAATAAARAQRAELRNRLAAPQAAIAAAEEALIASRAELTDADLVALHAHERHHSEAFLRNRRESQRRHRIAAAEAAYRRRLDERDALHDQLARVTEMVESELAMARLRAVRIFAHTTARIATYWEGLILAHRDGTHLAALLPHLCPRPPEWVSGPADGSTGDGGPPEPSSPEIPFPDTTAEGPDEATPQPLPAHRR